jgi:AsmA protein
MSKVLKWLLAGAGVVVVLIAIAAVVLPLVVDPNDYKDEISTAVLEETGRELTIGGDIKWTVFPSVGLGLSDLELGNRSGFGDQPMLKIGEAGLSVKLMPLFSKKVEIGQVSLTDVSANLRRKANGQNNWEDIAGSQSDSEPTSSPEGDGSHKITVSGVEVSNANVTWDDAGQITELKNFVLSVSSIEIGRPFKLEGGFSVNVSESQLSGEAEFQGLVSSQADGSQYGIEGLGFSFTGTQGPTGESMPLEIAVNANAAVNMSNDQATLSDFVFQFHDFVVNGELNVTSLSNDPKFEGQLSVPEFSPKSLLKALGQQAPQTADAAALTSLQAEMSFAGSSSSANMKNLNVKFDKSTFKGKRTDENFDHPKLGFNFQIDSLNLDEYLPETAAETLPAEETAAVESDLTVDAFRGFTGGGNFKIGTLIVAGLTATDVSLKMTSNGKGVRLNPISARFYDGQYKGDIKIDASGDRPILTANEQIAGVRAEGVLQDLTGSASLEGQGDFNVKIRTDLTNSKTTTENLSGNFGLSFLDGAIVGINIAETIRSANAALGKQADNTAGSVQDPKTDFSELTMTGVIEQGVIKSDDLMMSSPLLRVTGKGTVNLVNESIDYKVKPVLVGSLEGQGGQGLDQLKGVPIPVKLTGNMYEPDISVDILAAVTGAQKDALIGKLLDGGDDTETASGEGESKENADPAASLLNSVFGSKKDKKKKKKKKDDGGGN